MAKRKTKLVSIRKPRLKVSSKGLKVQAPSARVGGKAGLNLSKSGVSGSVRTKAGTYNTKSGCSSGCMFAALTFGLGVVGVLSLIA